ncbi:Ig-like domain-containing protein, partial [Undibacterium luofuense]
YTSSNPAVATVDAAGKVTTVSAGTVTITATQAAVVGVNVQATQSYSLTVNPTPVPVLSFTQAGPLQIILGNSLTNAVSSTLTGGSYGAVTYTSSNPAVATVDAAGKVTTVSAGTVTITATQAAVVGVNVQATQSYSLTVNPTPVPVLSFTQAGPLQIILGNSLTNAVSSTLTGGSYGAVTYTSSNPVVATVDAAGKVTTVSAGTVTITATQAAVVGVNVQATQSYSLTVNPTPVPVLSFTQAGPLQIILGNSLTNAVSSTLTGGSYGAVTYTSSNPAVATVDAAGKVTTVSAGTVTITATQAAVVGVNVQATQSYSLTVNPTPVPVLSFTQAGPLQIILGNSLTNAVSSTLTGGSYGAVTYTSSNPAVATVDAAGKVT